MYLMRSYSQKYLYLSINYPHLISTANPTVFLNLLQPVKRSRSQRGKPDFVGILTADSKGVCQLYKSLKDKEKTVS